MKMTLAQELEGQTPPAIRPLYQEGLLPLSDTSFSPSRWYQWGCHHMSFPHHILGNRDMTKNYDTQPLGTAIGQEACIGPMPEKSGYLLIFQIQLQYKGASRTLSSWYHSSGIGSIAIINKIHNCLRAWCKKHKECTVTVVRFSFLISGGNRTNSDGTAMPRVGGACPDNSSVPLFQV